MVNPSTLAARELVGALGRLGVRHVVLCAGSRSAPLAYALHAAEVAGVLDLHVRHDERSAGFTALGVGRAGHVAAVVTTSGTAVANLHPAVLEAHHGGVPLLVLAADRPHPLRGTWANQTSDLQAHLFGTATRFAADLAADADPAAWVGALEQAVAAARGPDGARPGPAHLDLAFDDPLTPDDALPFPSSIPLVRDTPARRAPGGHSVIEPGPRTVVVAGDGAGPRARQLAEDGGWPLLAEPTSGARGGRCAVAGYRLVVPHLAERVERVVVLGRPTLSRQVTALLDRAEVDLVVVADHQEETGPGRACRRVVGAVEAGTGPTDDAWLTAWQEAGSVARQVIDAVLDDEPLNGPLLAREVWGALRADERLVVAASNPVRDLDLAGHPDGRVRRVLANRGLSGIDGTMSTAVGVAVATGSPTRALVGDVAFLHDLGALTVPASERGGLDLQVVVLDDDGGGIFALLEHGEPQHASSFERVFGTPHGADLGALAGGFGVPVVRVERPSELVGALAAPPDGLSVVHVPVRRDGLRALHEHLRNGVARALSAT